MHNVANDSGRGSGEDAKQNDYFAREGLAGGIARLGHDISRCLGQGIQVLRALIVLDRNYMLGSGRYRGQLGREVSVDFVGRP